MELFFFILCFACLIALACCTLKNALRHLLKDFNRKIWMTLGLGVPFFSLYVFVVMFGSAVVRQWGTDFFFMMYKYPQQFVYGGLALFALLSLCIYLARVCIKYIYLANGKD